MPDADGRIRGITVPAEAWERVFGKPETAPAAEKGACGGACCGRTAKGEPRCLFCPRRSS